MQSSEKVSEKSKRKSRRKHVPSEGQNTQTMQINLPMTRSYPFPNTPGTSFKEARRWRKGKRIDKLKQ